MTPEELRRAINDGTFMELLMKETVITPHEADNGRVRLEIAFPLWYTKYVSTETRAEIAALVRANAQAAFRVATREDEDDGPTR